MSTGHTKEHGLGETDNHTAATMSQISNLISDGEITLTGTTVVDCSTAVQTHTMPAISTTNNGYTYRIGKTGINWLRIDTTGSDTVDSIAEIYFFMDNEYATFRANNTSKNWEIVEKVEPKLYAEKQVTLTNTMSNADILATIRSQPRNLSGNNLIFNFADGTYTLTEELDFSGFRGGVLWIRGNTSEDHLTLHSDQAVILDSSATDINTILMYNITSTIYVRNLHIKTKTDVDHRSCIYVRNVSYLHAIAGCRFECNSKANGYCLYFSLSNAMVRACYTDSSEYGISAYINSNVSSLGNDTLTVNSEYGLTASANATIGKSGSQPSGDTADENTSFGGVIRN